MTRTESARSSALAEEIHYVVHETPGSGPRSLLLLLAGRGDHATSWARVLPGVDDLVRAGDVSPLVVVMPEAPWSGGGHWYVDSAFTGSPAGRPVETALTHDLLPHVEASYDVVPDRAHRVVGGASMGGAGALRLLLSRPGLFGGGVVLSTPAHDPLPPEGSSARRFGAFGEGSERFVDDRWRSPSDLLAAFDPTLPVRLFLAAGAEEDDATGAAAASRVQAGATGTAGVDSRLAVLPGGHDWDVWEPAVMQGLPFVLGPRSGSVSS